MELFNEVKNRYFQLVFRVINECAAGKTKSEIVRILDEGEFEQKVIGKKQQSFADLILNRCGPEEDLHLIMERDGFYYPAGDSGGNPPLPVRFTLLEKAWLKALLEREEVRMLLESGTLEKLRHQLENVDSPIREEYFERTNAIEPAAIPDPENYEHNFRLLLEALIQEKAIRYNNTDKNGRVYTGKLGLPVSIEYSMRDGRFRLSMYSLDDHRPIMANIFSLSELRIVEEDVGLDRDTAKKLLFEQKYSEEPVILEVTDRKMAMERCFMCFSGMERTARDLGNHKYEIRLRYYLFEEENLIRDILSLGPYVKVLSPGRIANEVVARVKQAIAFQEIGGSVY